MKVYHPLILYGATRLKITFADDLGNEKSGFGVGIWTKLPDNQMVLLTNRHNLDYSFINKDFPNYKLSSLKIRLCKTSADPRLLDNEARYFSVNLTNNICGKLHPTADIAMIINPFFLAFEKEYSKTLFLQWEELATDNFINNWCEVFDDIGFIGFKQSNDSRIASKGSIANMHCNSYDYGTHVIEIEGKSLAGSSGSPVFHLAKGLNLKSTTPALKIECSHSPGKLIGIMTGHLIDACGNLIDRFDSKGVHTGVSYFTKISAFHELLEPSYGLPLKDFLYSTCYGDYSIKI